MNVLTHTAAVMLNKKQLADMQKLKQRHIAQDQREFSKHKAADLGGVREEAKDDSCCYTYSRREISVQCSKRTSGKSNAGLARKRKKFSAETAVADSQILQNTVGGERIRRNSEIDVPDAQGLIIEPDSARGLCEYSATKMEEVREDKIEMGPYCPEKYI